MLIFSKKYHRRRNYIYINGPKGYESGWLSCKKTIVPTWGEACTHSPSNLGKIYYKTNILHYYLNHIIIIMKLLIYNQMNLYSKYSMQNIYWNINIQNVFRK